MAFEDIKLFRIENGGKLKNLSKAFDELIDYYPISFIALGDITGQAVGQRALVVATGILYVWNGTDWIEDSALLGRIGEQGPQGIQGIPGNDGADGEVNQTDEEIKTQYENNADTNAFTDAEKTKLGTVENGAEANNISDANATDLTDNGDTTLHFHSADRARANHTGTQTMSTISDAGNLATLNTVDAAQIDDDAVTLDKIQNISTNRVLARSSAGVGSVEELTLPNFRSLINVEDGADVTDTTNVAAAGALMSANNLSDLENVTTARSNLNSQETLVSGTNIKTINSQSLLGSGNIEISGGGGGLRETIQIAGTQTVNTILYEGAIASASTLSAGYITLLTAPTGSSFIVSVSKSTDSGATYGTAETVTLTATNKYIKGSLTLAFTEGDFMKIEVTQVGSTVAGADLLFTVTGS